MAAGAFAALREARTAAPGGAPEQYKHPFLITDLELAARLIAAPHRRSG